MSEIDVRARARALYLGDGHSFGCAETAYMALTEAFGLPEGADVRPVMALNGGVGWTGNVCGAITGSAAAAGVLAGRLQDDRSIAKRSARELTAELVNAFRDEFGSVVCRDLIGRSIVTEAEHAEFIESGMWRTVCMGQIEFTVESFVRAARERFRDELAALEPGAPDPPTGGATPAVPSDAATPLPSLPVAEIGELRCSPE